MSITESTKKFNGDGFERHKIFIYKEDFNRFVQSLQDTVNEIKPNTFRILITILLQRERKKTVKVLQKKEDDLSW